MSLEPPKAGGDKDGDDASAMSALGEDDDDIEDDIPFDENSQSYFEEGEEEEGSFSSDAPEEGVQEKDRLLHWWCQRQLNRCLRKLKREPNSGPFEEPVPWEDLELDDYLEVVETPMDLKTISDRLDGNEYEDTDGLINPELFWADTALCWDNCLKYYEDDEELEACQMAKSMADIAQKLEDEFWVELEAFEQNIEEVDPTLGGVAAAMDVAAGTVEELAGVAYDSVANWFKSINNAEEEAAKLAAAEKKEKRLDFGRDEIKEYVVEYDPDAPASVMDYQFYRAPPVSLREHFAEILQLRYRYASQKELEDIEVHIRSSIISAKHHLDEREEDAEFEGAREKIPIARLMPGSKVTRAKQKAAPKSPKGKHRRQSAGSDAGSVRSGKAKRPAAKAKKDATDTGSGSSKASSRASSVGRSRWRRDRSASTASGASDRSKISAASGRPKARVRGSTVTSDSNTTGGSRGSLVSTASKPGLSSGALKLAALKNDPRMKALIKGKDSESEDEKMDAKKSDGSSSMNFSKLKGLLQKRKKTGEKMPTL